MSAEALVELQRVFLNVEEADRGQLDQVSCMASCLIDVENAGSLFAVIIKGAQKVSFTLTTHNIS
jgi:hypothetical protein